MMTGQELLLFADGEFAIIVTAKHHVVDAAYLLFELPIHGQIGELLGGSQLAHRLVASRTPRGATNEVHGHANEGTKRGERERSEGLLD
jgi:hypothetical protein